MLPFTFTKLYINFLSPEVLLCRDACAILAGVWPSVSHPSSSSPDQYGEPVVIITHWELTHTSACACTHTHTH